MDTWYDTIDWINTQKELLPKWGGRWVGAMTTGSNTVAYGLNVGSLPNGHIYPNPLADTMSPVQGMDKTARRRLLNPPLNYPSTGLRSAAR